jgi:UDP-N-acetylmuramate dehydrogenase
MKEVHSDFSLRTHNTFGIEAKARWFSVFSGAEELESLLDYIPDARRLILGGGSNILFTGDFDGLVLKNEIKGIEELNEDDEYIYVKAGAGENWHAFVQYCLARNWGGVENLSLIPGNVGASPMQNIGAYGVELRDVFWSLEAFHIKEKRIVTFTLNDCEFGYRESIFKTKFKGEFVILSVTFRLKKDPVLHTEYGSIKQELERMGVQQLSIQAISQAVINIRQSKLPDPHKIGNAGSFFKNPSVSKEKFNALKEKFEHIIGHAHADGTVKLYAGWLIEQCGWKGFRRGDAGVHAMQALVLVNYNHAKGQEIYDLSEEILLSVKEKFDVTLEREVNIV